MSRPVKTGCRRFREVAEDFTGSTVVLTRIVLLVRSTSRIRPGVENTSDGKCVASVLRMIRLAKELSLHLAEEVQTVEPLQIVEAVAALQVLHLHFEDEVERRAEHAAERHGLFGEAADPEIDVVEAAERLVIPKARRCQWH